MRKWLGAAICAPWIALSLVPAPVSASTLPTLLLTESASSIAMKAPVHLTATAQGLSGPLDYGFWVENPSGHWSELRTMSPNRTYTYTPTAPGTYWLAATVMTQKAFRLRDWKAVRDSLRVPLYVGATAAITPSSASVPINGALTLSGTSANISDALYQFWVETPQGTWIASGHYSSSSTFSPPVGLPGLYRAIVDVKTPGGPYVQSSEVDWHVYGPPSAIQFSQSRSTWVADGAEEEALTASVVDAEGDVVTNYTGAGTITDAMANGALSAWGTDSANLTPIAAGLSTPIAFKNGEATLIVQAGSTTATDTVTGETTTASGAVLSGTGQITALAQVATRIQLTTTSSYLIANESGNPANYAVSVLDQVGEPMLSGTYPLSASIEGPGQFQDLTPGPDSVTYTGGNGATPLTVYSIAALTGPMTLTIAGDNLPSAAVTVPAILGGQPYRMGVSAAQTTLKNGDSTTLTLTQLTSAGGVSDPASLDNSGYVVSITDANGNPATGFTLDGMSYTGPTTFAVATGPNYFYAVSQPISLTVMGAQPGIYTVTVSDADGLWKPSTPLAITVSN